MEDAILSSSSGQADELFHFLWKKRDRQLGCQNILIPQTVLFKFQQPSEWFFTSLQDGQIKRKHKMNTTIPNILEEFESLGQANASGILASFTYTASEHGQPATHMQYFDAIGLKQFFERFDRPSHGCLQQFIEPREFSSVLRVTWAPQLILLERRTNKHRICETKYDMYERVVTWEGALHLSETVPISGTLLAGQIQRTCETIASHVANVTDSASKIKQMVLHFKLDSRERCWLLWCSLLHVEGSLCPPQPTISVPRKASLRSSTPTSDLSAAGLPACMSCGIHAPVSQLFDVTYKTVIAHERSKQRNRFIVDSDDDSDSAVEELRDADDVVDLGDRRSRRNAENIPAVIKTAFPGLSYKRYCRLQKDPAFLYTTARVCETCCDAFNETVISEIQAREDQLRSVASMRMTPRMRPESGASTFRGSVSARSGTASVATSHLESRGTTPRSDKDPIVATVSNVHPDGGLEKSPIRPSTRNALISAIQDAHVAIAKSSERSVPTPRSVRASSAAQSKRQRYAHSSDSNVLANHGISAPLPPRRSKSQGQVKPLDRTQMLASAMSEEERAVFLSAIEGSGEDEGHEGIEV